MSTSGLVIEPLDSESYAEAIPLLARQLEEHAIAISAEALEHSVRGLVAAPGRGVLLAARVGGVTVGVAALSFMWTIEHGGQAAWLDELYVLPEHRERGIGTALLRAALETARADGRIALDLEVEASHERVASLYLRHGFQRRARTHFWRPLRDD